MKYAYYDSAKSEWVDLGEIRGDLQISTDDDTVFQISSSSKPGTIEVRTYMQGLVIRPQLGNSIELGTRRGTE